MPFSVYIIFSKKANRYYVGETEDVNARLQSHLAGISKYTSIANDWTVVHTEPFDSRGDAIRREREIKRMNRLNIFSTFHSLYFSFPSNSIAAGIK